MLYIKLNYQSSFVLLSSDHKSSGHVDIGCRRTEEDGLQPEVKLSRNRGNKKEELIKSLSSSFSCKCSTCFQKLNFYVCIKLIAISEIIDFFLIFFF